VANDVRLLKPSELCRLLNSTPLGEVINPKQLHEHRNRAGLRIGTGKHVDLLRYVTWLVQMRHTPKTTLVDASNSIIDLAEAALLTEPTYAVAAEKTGIGLATVYRWMRLPIFQAAYRQARREIVDTAIGRIQAATGQAVETLLSVARHGRRDGDRVRAAKAILAQACRGLNEGDTLHGGLETSDALLVTPNDVVAMLGNRLRQLDQSELPTLEKSRLTATLADALLRAIGVDVLDKRLEALQSVLLTRKNKKA